MENSLVQAVAAEFPRQSDLVVGVLVQVFYPQEQRVSVLHVFLPDSCP